MKKVLLTVFTICLSAAFCLAQKVPSFSNYKVKVEKITPKHPDLASHKDARMFRTNLRNAVKDGINFAGHFVLANWGCGTNCSESAIVDATTGRVFFPSVLQGIGIGFCDIDYGKTDGLEYKPDSRLLILSGFKGGDLNNENSPCGIYYMEWTGTNFKTVKFIQKKRTPTP